MSEMSEMIAAAKSAMIHVMDLVPDDTVLVITDESTRRIGDAFLTAANEHGCQAEMHLLPEPDRPLTQVPPEMNAKLTDKSVVINMFQAKVEEVPFRIRWIKEVAATKRIRLGHGPGITEAMMASGPMNVDYGEMRESSEKLMAAFTDASSVHITAPAGTDLTVGIAGRDFLTDTHITSEKGGNLPCGEIYCAPVETAADGLLVIDGCIGHIGNVEHPLRISLAKGKIVNLECEDPGVLAEVEKTTGHDAEANVIGELGIGLNPGAKLTGNMLEDEKAFRTAHIAFGCNDDMPGGQNHSEIHVDYLFNRPTMTVTYQDGSQKVVVSDGVVCG